MNRKLLSTSLILPFAALFIASACSLDDGTTDGTAGTGAGGTGTSGSSSTAGSSSGSNSVSGSSTGGSGTSGSATTAGAGGTTAGSGGAAAGGTGTAGSGGTTAGSGPGPITVDTFAGTKNENGFAFKDSYFMVACTEVQAHDCLTVQGACPNQNAANYDDKGSIFKEEFKLGGELGKTYTVTVKVNGIVEGKYYNGGTRRRGTDFSDANNANGTDAWHVGGTPQPTNYNVYKIAVFQPDGTTPVEHYYINSYPQASGFESHQTVPIGYEATFDVPGQAVIKYTNQDANCRAINNCGPGDNGSACPNARNVPNEPGLAVPMSYGGKMVNASFNVVNQAQQPFHAQMAHISVTKVELKP